MMLKRYQCFNKIYERATMKKCVFFVAMLLLVGLGAMCYYGNCEEEESLETYTKWVMPEIEGEKLNVYQKQETIQKEITTLKDHAWAGEYFYGFPHGNCYTLTLAPESGFTYINNGCAGVYRLNYGTVMCDGSKITLHPALTADLEFRHQLPTEFYLIPWGQRRYLIQPDEMLAFCNAVNLRREPREFNYGEFFLCTDGESLTLKTPAEKHPTVPEAFRHYLMPPTQVKVLAVGERRDGLEENDCSQTRLTLDKGEDTGFFVGLKFDALGKEEEAGFWSLTVTKVEKTQSEAMLLQRENAGMPEVGWKFGTGLEPKMPVPPNTPVLPGHPR